jgi:hypothetical protein
MHALGARCRVPTNSVVPQFGEIAGQGATLVDLMNTTGLYSLANRPRDPIHVHRTQGQSVELPHGSSELLGSPPRAHIVDDDSDHVLMRMTIPGHLVKRKSKTRRP